MMTGNSKVTAEHRGHSHCLMSMETEGPIGALTSKEKADIFIVCATSQFLILAPNEIEQRRHVMGSNEPHIQVAGHGRGGPACDL